MSKIMNVIIKYRLYYNLQRLYHVSCSFLGIMAHSIKLLQPPCKVGFIISISGEETEAVQNSTDTKF